MTSQLLAALFANKRGVLGTLVIIVVAGWATYNGARGQNKKDNSGLGDDRIIEKKSNSAIQNEPVEITVAKTKKGTVPFGRPFKDDDDEWTKGLTLTVKNVSSKNVVYIEIRFSFERPQDDANSAQPPLVHSLFYGTSAPAPDSELKVLAPDDSVNMMLADETFESLKRALVKVGYTKVKRLRVYLSQVIFQDGSMWLLGKWYRRDPANPQTWLDIPAAGVFRRRGRSKSARFVQASFSHNPAEAITQTPQCWDPGFPSWATCTGASNEDCRKRYQPTFEIFSHTHKDKTILGSAFNVRTRLQAQ
jgi:hypothetical protein